MVPRALFERLGGFDDRSRPPTTKTPTWPSAFAKGLQAYQPAAVVVHHEGISHGTDTGSGIKAYQVENQRKFGALGNDTLAAHYPNATLRGACARSRLGSPGRAGHRPLRAAARPRCGVAHHFFAPCFGNPPGRWVRGKVLAAQHGLQPRLSTPRRCSCNGDRGLPRTRRIHRSRPGWRRLVQGVLTPCWSAGPWMWPRTSFPSSLSAAIPTPASSITATTCISPAGWRLRRQSVTDATLKAPSGGADAGEGSVRSGGTGLPSSRRSTPRRRRLRPVLRTTAHGEIRAQSFPIASTGSPTAVPRPRKPGNRLHRRLQPIHPTKMPRYGWFPKSCHSSWLKHPGARLSIIPGRTRPSACTHWRPML